MASAQLHQPVQSPAPTPAATSAAPVVIAATPAPAPAAPAPARERIHWIDIAKAFAIAGIVWGHSLGPGTAMNIVYAFHVPLFFFLSGMTYKYRPGMGPFAARKARQLLVPYLVFGLLSIVAYQVLGAVTAQRLGVTEAFLSPLDCLKGLAFGTGILGGLKFNLPLWFLPCLFVIECIVQRVCEAFDDRGKTPFGPAGALVLALLAALGIVSTFFMDQVVLPFSLTTGLIMLPFFALGMVLARTGALGRLQESIGTDAPGRAKLALAGVVLLAAGIALALLNATTMGYARIDYVLSLYGVWPLYYLAALVLGGGVVALSMAIQHSRPLEYVGRNTLAILVMHKFPILFCQTILPLTRDALATCNTPASAVVALLAILASLAVAVPIARFLPWALGKPMQRRTSK